MAEEAEAFAATGKDDSLRPLTKAGKRKMKEVAAGLLEIVESLDVLAASPLVRAQQTAEIVAKAYGDIPVDTVQALSPGSDPSGLVDWLGEHASAELVAVVGHEPHLGMLVTWLMTEARESRVAVSKGGAALLEFSSRVTAGSATLQWLLTGSQLRRIGQ
jgi:phosphohistidine phosphatase